MKRIRVRRGEEVTKVIEVVLNEYNKPLGSSSSNKTIDSVLSNLFKSNSKSIQEKNKSIIIQTCYDYVKWKSFIEDGILSKSKSTLEQKIKQAQQIPYHIQNIQKLLENFDISLENIELDGTANVKSNNHNHRKKSHFEIGKKLKEISHKKGQQDEEYEYWSKLEQLYRYEPHVLLSFPQNLYEKIVQEYGKPKGHEICLYSNLDPPFSMRVNPMKTTREDLYNRLLAKQDTLKSQQYKPVGIKLSEMSNLGITFEYKPNDLLQSPEYREGLFELQDEASQLVSSLIDPKPGDIVLDYCAGSGGKTLAFAHKLKGKGQILLHDIRKDVLEKAKIRLRRASLQNAQLIEPEISNKKLLQWINRVDWLVLDVPCSSSGSFKRHPDLKWSFTKDRLMEYIETQRRIFSHSIDYVKKGGHIVYITCSIFQKENEQQVDFFLNNYPVVPVHKQFKSIPQKNMDGFFAFVFRKI